MTVLDLSQYGIHVKDVRRNLAAAILYQEALRTEKDSVMASSGALIAYSYAKTGRSPKDKYIVRDDNSRDTVWWSDQGKNDNNPIDQDTWDHLKSLVTARLSGKRLYVMDTIFCVNNNSQC